MEKLYRGHFVFCEVPAALFEKFTTRKLKTEGEYAII